MLMGRNSQNAVVVFPKGDLKPGMYVNVLIDSSTSSTLIGSVLN
jgi:tRNA-2-methylthio-N6-dimethylallyladenosine synthase